jgi:hypothetical protein
MDVPVVRIGEHAARFLDRHSRARVTAVFERSLHLEAGGAFLCVGGEDIGNGPLNAIVDGRLGADLLARNTPGSVVAILERMVLMAGFRLDAREARLWRPAAIALDVQPGAAVRGARAVSAIVERDAPADGLSRLAFGLDSGGSMAGVLARVAAPHLAELVQWIEWRLTGGADGEVPRCAPCRLLGMGPGLTPSGDDLFCGVLIALFSLGRGDVARDLAEVVAREAAVNTTALSGAFLRAACDGQGSEALHEAIAAIMHDDTGALPALVCRLGEMGHTSGWDALAGAWLAITAWDEATASKRFRE